MKQLIYFNKEKNIFHLSNHNISYIMELENKEYLIHRYWGRKIDDYNFGNKPNFRKRTFAANLEEHDPNFSFEFLPLEFSTPDQGDFRSPSLKILNENNQYITRFKYSKHKILNSSIELDDMPHARKSSNAETLIIYLTDCFNQVELQLFYTVFSDSDVIIRSTKIINNSVNSIQIKKIASFSLDTLYSNQNLRTYSGTHKKEYQLNNQKIGKGILKTGSNRGASGPQYPPFFSLSLDANEFRGEVYGFSMIYSGNHEEIIERDQYNQLRIQIGLNSDNFIWTLKNKESFQSPQAILSYIDEGYNGQTQNFQHFFKDYIINPHWKNERRPILINSWEMAYYDVSENVMKEVIESAHNLGFEMVVLDDGWYGKRNDSSSSLGDWIVNKKKFPNGLKTIIDFAKDRNIDFGLWFEPEMISPDSKLIDAHPEWVMRGSLYEPLQSRSQYVLDLTNEKVQEFILKTISTYIEELDIKYIKWDMNRHMTDPYSQLNANKSSTAFMHKYILGLYRILDTLTKKYPHILFENSSSGGGRLDPGMLYYFPQTWISDNTDAYDRQSIFYGATNFFPISSLTGHVSDVPNHQTGRSISFETRAALASSSNMGYEMDIINVDTKTKNKIKKHIHDYKNERSIIFDSKFYRLSSPFESNISSWMYVADNRKEAIVYVFRNLYNVNELFSSIRIPYLDTNTTYIDLDTKLIYSGDELAYSGLVFDNPAEDFIVNKIHLKDVNNFNSTK